MSVSEPHAPTEEQKIETWRLQTALELGYSPALAELVAAARHVDLHELERMISRGCDRSTAFEILR